MRSPAKKLKLILLVAVVFVLLLYLNDRSSFDFQVTHTGPKKKVLIAVPILIGSVDRRQAIRDTWGKFESWPNCEVELTLTFFVGNSSTESEKLILEKESLQFKDIIHLNLNESYHALTNKTVNMFTHIVNQNSISDEPFDYVIKTDDDTFVNIPVICREFAKMPEKEVFGGRCHMASKPYRPNNPIANLKLVLTLEEYPASTFPPHCEGPFYYLSKDMTELLLKGFKVSKLIKMEDVSVGIALNSVLPNLSTKIKFTSQRYQYLPSHQKSKGLEVQWSKGSFGYKWAFHPVVTYSRMYQMQEATTEINAGM